ncbi:MAG: phospholipid carrier-dependent glycosyltransferase [Chloroflexota bacterium]
MSKLTRLTVEILILFAIVAIAAVFRWTGLDWDDYKHYHPDERYITWVATTIEAPPSLANALVPNQATFNPFYWPADADSPGIVVPQDEQRAFAYGHFPLYLGVSATRWSEWLAPRLLPRLPEDWLLSQDLLNGGQFVEFVHLTAVSRALTGLFDLGTIILTYFLARRLFGTAVAILSALFLTFNVMHIQLAHFFISDPYLTFFIVAAILCWVEALHRFPRRNHPDSERKQRRVASLWLWLGCVMVGLAVGSKFAAIILLLPLAIVIWVMWPKGWLWRIGLGIAISFASFFVTNPFAIVDLSCEVLTPAVQAGPVTIPALDWRSCYLDNIVTQRAMVSGQSDLPFTRQYTGSIPFLYYIEMQLKWGMGPLLGLVAFGGFVWALWQVSPGLWRWTRASITNESSLTQYRSLRRVILTLPMLIVLAWCIPYFLSTGTFFVKFMRYLQPLVPFLMIMGAAMLWQIKRPLVRYSLITAVLVTTAVYATAFLNMYRLPHPWLLGSGWIYTNVEPDTLILSEKWDDALPTSLNVGGEYRRRSEYRNEELSWLTKPDGRDDDVKLQVNLALMSEAEYLTVVSNRIYGVVTRLPDRYPISSQYYQLLFDGELGYEPVFVFERSPTIAGWTFRPDTFTEPDLIPPQLVQEFLDSKKTVPLGRADESFTVYDQSLTIIFENKEHLTVDEMMELFEIDN